MAIGCVVDDLSRQQQRVIMVAKAEYLCPVFLPHVQANELYGRQR
jgi:hypothetical protein